MCDEGQHCRLTGIGLDGKVIAVHIQPVNDIRADKLDRDTVTRLYTNFGREISELPGFHPEDMLPWRGACHRKRSECHDQSDSDQ